MDTYGQEPGRGKKKWLFGCAGGCLGFIVVCAACLGIMVYLAVREAPIAPPETFITSGADAFVVAKVGPGNMALLGVMLELVQGSGVELAERGLEPFLADPNLDWDSAMRLGGIQIVTVLQYGPEGAEEGAHAFVCSIQKMSGLLRWIFNRSLKDLPQGGGPLTSYKDVRIAALPDGSSLAAKRNNFMFALDVQVIKDWIDRIEEQAQAGESAAVAISAKENLERVYKRLADDAPLRFAGVNPGAQLESLLPEGDFVEAIKETGLVALGVEALGASFQVVAAREAQVNVYALCADQEGARQLAGKLESRGAAMEQQFQIEGWRVATDGQTVELEFRVPQFRQKLRAATQG